MRDDRSREPVKSEVLADTLYEVLCQNENGDEQFERELARLDERHGTQVYSELLYLMCHLRFEPDEARRHWLRIVEHRETLRSRLGADVDLRVALTSYFIEVNRHLRNPKIIELKLFNETERSASRDSLTGLCNYRLFREHLAREVEKCRRDDTALSLAMIDVDDFKHYNDRNGHESGNDALSRVARVLESSVREIDVVARYGGEEFALILPSTSKVGALRVAERARSQTEKHAFPHGATQPGGGLTVSVGIATCPADAADAQELIERADQAMYLSKARGKNQVCLFGQDRRSYRRIDASIDGQFCILAAEFLPMVTANLSERGLLLHVERGLPLGSLIDVRLDLPGSRSPVCASGRVVRVEEREDGLHAAAIRIVEIAPNDRRRLNQFIRDLRALAADGPTPDLAATSSSRQR